MLRHSILSRRHQPTAQNKCLLELGVIEEAQKVQSLPVSSTARSRIFDRELERNETGTLTSLYHRFHVSRIYPLLDLRTGLFAGAAAVAVKTEAHVHISFNRFQSHAFFATVGVGEPSKFVRARYLSHSKFNAEYYDKTGASLSRVQQ